MPAGNRESIIKPSVERTAEASISALDPLRSLNIELIISERIMFPLLLVFLLIKQQKATWHYYK
jgi:hypothetical protein